MFGVFVLVCSHCFFPASRALQGTPEVQSSQGEAVLRTSREPHPRMSCSGLMEWDFELSLIVVCLLQTLYVNFVHCQHGGADAGRSLRIFVLHELAKDRGDDLPGQAVFVLEPAATALFAAVGKLVPEFVDFFL